jgi:PAS domain S-box-containing protein
MLIRERADASLPVLAEAPGMELRTGDALFVFDEGLTIRSWNHAAEELTGLSADEAVGRPCWDVLGASEDGGALVCHAGCAHARLARKGWPVRCHDVVIRTSEGRRRVALSTIALNGESPRLFVHLLHNAPEQPRHDQRVDPADLTPRQLQVLALVADGLAAKAIADRLGISISTVRNHVRAILVELGCHSQLEAVAQARRRGLLL